MTMQLRKAERKQSKLRIGMAGPSGSGKTYSALKMARGLVDSWDKIAMIDTENKRGDLYSHLGDYNIITLEAPFTPERFIEAIRACEKGGMEVIIIDSSSHEWDGPGGCLELNEKLAATKFKGNTWAAWSETTPRHQKFIEAIIASPCHIITTIRSKTDTIQTEDKKIKKVGLKEIQREGFEYELTVSFNIDRDNHYAIVGKDNTEIFKNTDPFIIDVEHGQKIRDWNESGKINTIEQKREIVRQLERIGLQTKDGNQIKADVLDITGLELVEENFAAIIEKLKETSTIEQQIEQQIDESKNEAPTAPTEAEKPTMPTVEEKIKKLESDIAIEEMQLGIAEESPTDTKQFHVALENQRRRLQEMRKELATLKPTVKEKTAEAVEAPTLIGPAKINLLRTLAAQKEGITDDKTFCGWLSYVHEIEVSKLDELNTVQATKVINSLLKQPNLTNEADVTEEGAGA